MRRTLAVLAAATAVVLVTAPASFAAESIPSGSWAGSSLDAGPATVEVGSYRLNGAFRRGFDRQVEVTISATPAGSGPCAISPTTLPRANTPRGFGVTLTIPCNGIYTVIASAVTTDNNLFLQPESASLDRRVTVAAPPPVVTGVTATASGRSVTVKWNDMIGGAPDLSGYAVERKIGTGVYKPLASPPAGTESYVDSDLPASAGTATYRVFATRPSPDGAKVSAASDEAATPFVAAPQSTTSTTAAGGDPASGGAAAGADGSGSPASADGTGTGPGGQPASGGSGAARARVNPPQVFAGTFLPPLLRPITSAGPTTSTTADPGYEDALPYGAREQGAEDAVVPNDGMASIFTNGQPGRGMAIPVATALVLLVWALHLRMLARAARPLD
jgi:hypothetical protein